MLFQTSSLLVTLRKTNVFLKLTKNVVPCVRGLAVRSSLRSILSEVTMTMGWDYPWAFIFQWSRLLCMRLKEKWRHEGYVTAYSLRLRRSLTSVSNVCEAAPLLLCPQRTRRITRSVSSFVSYWLANRQWLFQQVTHCAYSNPGTEIRVRNKDFGAISKTDLTRVQYCLWRRLHSLLQSNGEQFPFCLFLGKDINERHKR